MSSKASGRSSLAVLAVSFASIVGLASGCESRSVTGDPVLVDPEAVSRDPGATDEIIQVADAVITNLLDCARLDPDHTYRVVLDEIVNSTGIREYDARLFYNRLLARLLSRAPARFIFLDEQSVYSDGRLAADVDLRLRIELPGLPGTRTHTIQYNVRLITIEGEIACAFESSFVKRR